MSSLTKSEWRVGKSCDILLNLATARATTWKCGKGKRKKTHFSFTDSQDIPMIYFLNSILLIEMFIFHLSYRFAFLIFNFLKECRIKLYLRLTKYYAIKAFGGVDV
jgi:hypothetical protein